MPKHRPKKRLDLLQYSDESFFIAFPDASEEDYMNYLDRQADDLGMIIHFEKSSHIEVTGIRRVIIEEPCWQWLKQERLANSSENRIAYANQLTDQEVANIWREYDFEEETGVLYLPVTLFSTISPIAAQNTPLDADMVKQLTQLIKNGIGFTDFVIFPQMVRVHQLSDEFEEKLIETYEAKADFKPSLTLALQKEINLEMRFIPVVYHQIMSAIVSKVNLMSESKQTISEAAAHRISSKLEKKLGSGMKISIVPMLEPNPLEAAISFQDTLDEAAALQGVNVVKR